MPRLSLALLGPFHLTLDGRPAPSLATDKARALLAYLAVEADRPHRRESLAGRLWPDLPEARALHNLRQTLLHVRQGLAEDEAHPHLLVTAKTVQFNRADAAHLDVAVFTGLLAACERHAHTRLERCAECVARLEQAAALYRGDFLEGFSLRDTVLFEEWLLVQRERLHRQALDALAHLAAAYEARGQFDQAQAAARRQLALEPSREVAHRQLMRALALAGEREAALAQYETCRRALADELGVPPTDKTTALYERLKRGQPLVWLHNFPARLTSFVGREAELAQLGEALQDPRCRLLTLTGPGGSGKTRLAVEVAAAEAITFPDGACFVSLGPLVAASQLPGALVKALGLPAAPSQDPFAQALAFLRDKAMLLILDNFEHLLSAAPLVTDLLAACPGVTLLVTSREALRVRGEREFTVAPLPTPGVTPDRPVTVETLRGVPSVALFVHRSQAGQPGFDLDAGNALAVAQICDRLDGLPLAIELVAARVKLLQPAEIQARLHSALAFLPAGERDLPPRQQTLWATLEWSHSLLTPTEQTLLRRLAVFPGGFTVDAVEAGCNADGALGGDALNALAGLVNKSLAYRVRRRGEAEAETRYAMLATVREYADLKLREAVEAEATLRHRLDYYVRLAEASEKGLNTAERPLWLARLDAEQVNLQTALEQAYDTDPTLGLRLATALGTLWEVRVRLFTGRQALERALARGGAAPAALRAKALYWLGRLGLRQGQLRAAQAELGASLALYRELGDRRGVALALNDLGSVHHWRGDFAAAQACLTESLALRQELGEVWSIAQTLTNLGITAFRAGDYPAAQAHFEACQRAFEQTGAAMPLAWPLGGQGEVALARGDYAEAERLLEQSAALWRTHRFNWALAYRLNDLGLLRWLQGQFEAARAVHHEALTIAQEIGDARGLTFALEGLARVAAAQADAGTALALFASAEAQRGLVGTALGVFERDLHTRLVEQLRAALGETAAAEAWRRGGGLSVEQALALAALKVDSLP